jgi:transposase-like protein
MTQKRKHYSRQFKIDAVKLVTEQGYKVSEAARNLGIHHSSLRRWKKQLETDGNQSFPGKGHNFCDIILPYHNYVRTKVLARYHHTIKPLDILLVPF